ncbi:MAG: hypothetical protein ABIT07_08810 [Ferruginibacter sp.]
MKTPGKILLILLLCVSATVSYGQQKIDPRPKLFNDLPEIMKANDAALANAFNYFEGQNVSVALSNTLTFSGVVLSNEVKYSNLQNIIIKSAVLNNALLSLSKIINEDKSITYTGRILNNKAFDGFEIVKDETGQYNLQKFENSKILVDCNYQ